jgi:hypothetical protein
MDGIAFGCLAAVLSSRWRVSKSVGGMLFGLGIFAIVFIEICRGWVHALGLTRNGLYVTILDFGTAGVLFGKRPIAANPFCRAIQL